MTEKELIAKIKELRQIKPRSDWVLLTKKEIFTRDFNRDRVSVSSVSFGEIFEGLKIILSHKYAFSSLVLILVIFGVFGFSQNSLPGDVLFSIKRIAEKSQAVFVSEKEQPKHNLELVNKRLDDLTRVAETNSAKKLGPAINEFQASVSKAAKSLANADSQAVKEIVLEVKKLEEKTEQIKSLGVEIGESEELDNALAKIVEREIKDLEERTLTEKQSEILVQVKEDFEKGNYSSALEKILLLNQ